MTIGLLNITDEEWDKAEKFFRSKQNKRKTKLEKSKHSTTEHSFIKIPGKNPGEYEIFAMASSYYVGEAKYAKLGEGAFGKVKVVQNRNGENFAVKIEGRGLRGEHDVETKITKLLKFTIGEVSRKLPNLKTFKNIQIREKLYTVMQLKKGKELHEYIYEPNNLNPKMYGKRFKGDKALTTKQKLLTALKICKEVQELHDKGIIHGDLKLQNLMADIDRNQIVIGAIDFGFSMMLNRGEYTIENYSVGTREYMAPEIDHSNKKVYYTFASDIYALGKIFRDRLLYEDPKLSIKICPGMIHHDPKKRDSMYTTMSNIITELEKETHLDSVSKNFISDIKNEIKEDSELNDKLNTLFTEFNAAKKIKEKYDLQRKKGKPGSWGTTSWMISKAKQASSSKKATRATQIDKLATEFDKLKKNNKISANEKTRIALSILHNTRNEIKHETNLFDSSLKRVCKSLESEIDGVIGKKKLQSWNLSSPPKPKSTFFKFR